MTRTKFLAVVAGLTGVLMLLIVTVSNMTDLGAYRNLCKGYPVAIQQVEGEMVRAQTEQAHEDLEAKLADLDQQAADAGCSVEGSKVAASAAPSVAPTSSNPTTSPEEASRKEKANTKAIVAANGWTPTYYTFAKNKRSERDFGPTVKGGEAAANGDKKALAAIRKEWWKRMENDPSLASTNGGLILNGKDGGKKQIEELLKSKSNRDEYIARVKREIKSTRVEIRYAQNVQSAWMVKGRDGLPRTISISTYRPGVYYVFVVKTKGGKEYSFNLACGFQWDTGKKFVPRVYTPLRHTPYTSAPPCVNRGDRDDNGRCRPPSGGGHNPPPGRHTPPPSGGCDEPCGTPPPCRGKTCERGPEAPGNRSRPSGAPTRNAEIKAPARPDRPATTDTPVVKAPDASDSPSDSSSAPADDDGSQENTGGGDPDN